MKKISTTQLVDLLIDIFTNMARKTTFVTFTAVTDARCRKNPFGKIFKHSKVNVNVGGEYQSMVNRQRAREEKATDFVKKEHPWGIRLGAIPFGVHKDKQDKLYLIVKVEKVLETLYFSETGKPLTYEDVKPYLPKKYESRQELDKEVYYRWYGADTISELATNHERFQVVESDPFELLTQTSQVVATYGRQPESTPAQPVS